MSHKYDNGYKFCDICKCTQPKLGVCPNGHVDTTGVYGEPYPMTNEQIKCPFCGKELSSAQSICGFQYLCEDEGGCNFNSPYYHNEKQAIAAIKSIKIEPDNSELLPCIWCDGKTTTIEGYAIKYVSCLCCRADSPPEPTKEEAIKTHNQMYRKLHGNK